MLSLTADYALRAMLLLARPENKGAIAADEIALATGTPRNYMAKVLNVVAKAGLVSGSRGPAGGFALAVPAREITIGRVIDLFDSATPNPRCMLGKGPCNPARPCRAHDLWTAVTQARRSPFDSTTIADLLEGRLLPIAPNAPKETRHVA